MQWPRPVVLTITFSTQSDGIFVPSTQQHRLLQLSVLLSGTRQEAVAWTSILHFIGNAALVPAGSSIPQLCFPAEDPAPLVMP